ncbi:hypothetical protein K6U06_17935 [Acidiferrimicrobium sp. IK]|uniref:hypothetical protein n=1 Tax=Acidiferrimicrobium sp. IK TaxID=2871700 RepID=UPI0021CB24B8|nr:hypothetical protein [Acidiferrimicrobium sp. IK]MCU4186251.1 hypothetical protein [Acidiferrimicrobium sp. IK]
MREPPGAAAGAQVLTVFVVCAVAIAVMVLGGAALGATRDSRRRQHQTPLQAQEQEPVPADAQPS